MQVGDQREKKTQKDKKTRATLPVAPQPPCKAIIEKDVGIYGKLYQAYLNHYDRYLDMLSLYSDDGHRGLAMEEGPHSAASAPVFSRTREETDARNHVDHVRGSGSGVPLGHKEVSLGGALPQSLQTGQKYVIPQYSKGPKLIQDPDTGDMITRSQLRKRQKNKKTTNARDLEFIRIREEKEKIVRLNLAAATNRAETEALRKLAAQKRLEFDEVWRKKKSTVVPADTRHVSKASSYVSYPSSVPSLGEKSVSVESSVSNEKKTVAFMDTVDRARINKVYRAHKQMESEFILIGVKDRGRYSYDMMLKYNQFRSEQTQLANLLQRIRSNSTVGSDVALFKKYESMQDQSRKLLDLLLKAADDVAV